MKRNVLTRFVLIAVATLVVSMVPTVQARTCSNATAAGTWGFTTTGTFLFPSPSGPVLVPIVNVGIFTADEAGNFVGSQTRNVAGAVADETIKGTLMFGEGHFPDIRNSQRHTLVFTYIANRSHAVVSPNGARRSVQGVVFPIGSELRGRTPRP